MSRAREPTLLLGEGGSESGRALGGSVADAKVPLTQPVHAQTAAAVTDEHRRLIAQAADLCRAQPATYAAVVRCADQLRASGAEHFEALRLALAATVTATTSRDDQSPCREAESLGVV